MVMVHGDDKVQVIVIHVPYRGADVEKIKVACLATVKTLCDLGIHAEADLRENYSPGWKYSHWEMEGVPLRIEIGLKDVANNQVRVVRSDNGEKVDISMADLVKVKGLLDDI